MPTMMQFSRWHKVCPLFEVLLDHGDTTGPTCSAQVTMVTGKIHGINYNFRYINLCVFKVSTVVVYVNDYLSQGRPSII